MNNLLHADFRRLLRDRLFWVLTAVMAIWAIILFLNHYSEIPASSVTASMRLSRRATWFRWVSICKPSR